MIKFRFMPLMMSALIMAFSLTGCGTNNDAAVSSIDKESEIHLTVVLGTHNNAPIPNLNLIREQVLNACLTGGAVTLIVDDGDPFATVIDIPAPADGLSENKYIQIATEEAEQILAYAGQLQAMTEEVNTLRAVQLGGRSLESAKAENADWKIDRQMVILDSCLATTGSLSFVDQNLNKMDAENVVAQLTDLEEIPSLSDVSVTVYTCGDTAGTKQKKLPESSRKALVKVWETILTAGGASVEMRDDLYTAEVYEEDSLPAVTPVSVICDSAEIHNVEDVEESFAGGGIISFGETGETSIAFCKGTAELADTEKAKEAMVYVTEYMTAHPDFKLLVCGTTAKWGGLEYTLSLSKDRANAVCRLLTEELGIEPSRVKAVGVGYRFAEFYTYDQTQDGELDPELAPLNRSVKLLDMESETAARILNMDTQGGI